MQHEFFHLLRRLEGYLSEWLFLVCRDMFWNSSPSVTIYKIGILAYAIKARVKLLPVNRLLATKGKLYTPVVPLSKDLLCLRRSVNIHKFPCHFFDRLAPFLWVCCWVGNGVVWGNILYMEFTFDIKNNFSRLQVSRHNYVHWCRSLEVIGNSSSVWL